MNNVYNNLTFSQVFPSVDLFQNDWESFIALKNIPEDKAQLTWYLLTAQYGSTPIANQTADLFKIKVFSTMYQYGPSWVKKLEIQETIRELSVDELRTGAKNIYNRALNPDTAPTTDTIDEITYINEQNVQKTIKSPLQAYNELKMILEDDVTKEYISRFKKFFRNVVMCDNALLYVTEEEE